jgi:4-azaleucine resistance transporter AzlC
LAAGIALYEAGFTPFFILLMSLFVFTGAGQFMAASMTAAGAAAPSIIIMNLFLSLRMSLMTSSLAPNINHRSAPFLVLFGHSTADESFGVNTYAFSNDEDWTPNKALAANIIPYLVWVASTYAGAVIGSSVDIPTTIVNYLLIAMFISMLVDQLSSAIYVLVAIVAMVLAVVLAVVLQNNISIVIAAVLASFIGYLIDEYTSQQKDTDEVKDV